MGAPRKEDLPRDGLFLEGRGPYDGVMTATSSFLGFLFPLLRTLALAGTMVAVGCNSGDESSSALAGTSWRVSAWAEASPNPADHTITARFTGTEIGGTSAVNHYGGAYSAGGDGSFSVGALQTTEMAGPPESMRAEATFHRLLSQARRYEREGTRLTLRDSQGASMLVFRAEP